MLCSVALSVVVTVTARFSFKVNIEPCEKPVAAIVE
jgi:hypothetical protein